LGKNYLLIDVLNLVFRTFHSVTKFQGIDTEEKQLANIDLFVHSILKNVLNNRKLLGKKYPIDTEGVILAFDSYSWRRDFLRNDKEIQMSDEDYKAGRSKANQTVIKLIVNRLEEVAMNIGIKIVKIDKLEADDIIAMFPTMDNINNPLNQYVILSNDDDFTQLAKNPNIHVRNPITNLFNLKDGTVALTIKTFIGDTSDSIPNPYIPLKLENSDVVTQYGILTVLRNINGRFSCKCPNKIEIAIEFHNGQLEIYTKQHGEKSIVYSSNKTKIEFDKNYKLSLDINLKFDKDILEEEQESTKRKVQLLLEQIIEHGDNTLELKENYEEDFILNVVTGLVDKYKKEHKTYIKSNFEELTRKEITEKNNEDWIKDLVLFNNPLFHEDIMTKEEVINTLTKSFKKNLDRNFQLIDFNNIPQELQELFRREALPQLLIETLKPDRVEYLRKEEYKQIADILHIEQNKEEKKSPEIKF